MSTNEKEFLVWLLVVMLVSFLVHHLVATVVFALSKAVAMNLLTSPGASHFAAVLLPFC